MIFRRARDKSGESGRGSYTPAGSPSATAGERRDVLYDYIHHPAFKRLLNHVAQRQDEFRVKSLAVISEYPGEGKTFFTSALALGYAAFMQKRVLVVDTVCESREQSYYIGRVTGSPDRRSNKNGGSIELITSHTIHQEIYLHHSHEPNQQVQRPVTGGYYSADFQMRDVIVALSPTYDIILVDTCALSNVAKSSFDPIVLAQQVDGVILVNSHKSLEKDAINRLKSELNQSRIKVIGTIFNQGLS